MRWVVPLQMLLVVAPTPGAALVLGRNDRQVRLGTAIHRVATYRIPWEAGGMSHMAIQRYSTIRVLGR